MKVLMQGRFGLFSTSGGDRIQVENTAAELQKLGVDVDISDDFIDDLSAYDLVHIFQLDWTPETHLMIKKAKNAGKPVVFSPIHHNVEEVKKFDDIYVFDYRRLSRVLFKEQHSRDTFKNVYRSVRHHKKMKPTIYSIFHGLKNMHIKSLKMADIVIVATELEALDLKKTYGVEIKWVKISNGVSHDFINTKDLKSPFDFKNYIFCVGRIEPRKNQLKIIDAAQRLRNDLNDDIKLVLVGKRNSSNHFEYTIRFNQALKKYPWIVYLTSIDYKDMPAYFKYAKVCISASWFETTGLTLLESLFCGTNAVASSPRAKEILGDLASYCDPADTNSIYLALKQQYLSARPILDDCLRKEYTWENCAKKTYQVYKDLLKV